MSNSSFYNVFAHLTAEKSHIYRAILGEFTLAKSRFVIHLRPDDIERALRESRGLEPGTVTEAALQALVAWGNLESHPDTSEVATVEDFWRVRFLYQMSPAGAAAEAALAAFEESIRKPGELQSAALDDIRGHLARIEALCRSPRGEREGADDAEVANIFSLTWRRFEELTSQAQRFMAGIQRRIDLQTLDMESFLTYKQKLIDYLERFLRELVMATHAISMQLAAIDPGAVKELLYLAADRELVDRLVVAEEERAANREAWVARWEGLCAWFVGTNFHPAQAEELRGAARSAIPSLIATVTGINDRRAGHSDRCADFTTLALWFGQSSDDEDAHRLWRAAFALNSCRHLSIDQETLEQREAEPIASTTSWLDAPPLRISPRLHKSGRYTPRGRPASIIDRTEHKARLAQLTALENQQIQRARGALCAAGRTRLSELALLDEMEFQLLLDLLGDALATGADGDSGVSVASSDGSLRIDLVPTRDGRTAEIRTTGGTLTGEDHFVFIRSEFGDAAVDVPEEAAAGAFEL
jgi:uncharacterized protein (TIGR02677 family)